MIKKCPKCRREYDTTNKLCPVDGTVLERVGDPLEGSTLADKYRIEERLSAGGMGAVYRATHVLMDKKVAVKVLHPALASDESIVQRFTREARAASRISHPHALNVTDFGESDNGIVFLVMEYLRGRTLKEVIREEGVLTLPRTIEIMRQVAGALDAAHAEGVVHRDLKSDNIMLEEVGGHTDWAKVLDFGIAKIQEPAGVDPALTAPNLVIGTPQYMSPEQCSQSSNIDKRSDIYSLGIILFEMLTGHVPFTGDSPTAIMMHQMQDAPPSVLDARPDLPADVAAVLDKALAKKPEDRFDGAGEFAESLAQAAIQADIPVAASAVAMGAGSTGTSEVPSLVVTDAVASSTAANEGIRKTTVMDAADVSALEDATVLSKSRASGEMMMSPPVAAPAGMGSPWRIMVPAALALIGVLGLAYAFTGDSKSQGDDAPGVLRADPNGQPAQEISPTATGASERDIAPRGSASPTSDAANGTGGAATSSPNNTTGALPPDPGGIPEGGSPVVVAPAEEAGTTENGDANDAAANENTNDEAAENPTPAANRNANRRDPVLTPPTTSSPVNLNAPPPPPTPAASPRTSPSPRRRPAARPSPQQSPAGEPPAATDEPSPDDAPAAE